ncbi:MAG: sigma-70 family RNA polymerase sigma factor [Clostridiales bacterium]|nr:sigma-70 family RNA polymerase sigma factor [Clostridiales bacterium]
MTNCHRFDLTNETLVDLIQSGNDPDGCYILQLWQQNKGLIWKLAGKYAGYAEKDDLIQEGYIGLSNAVRSFHSVEGVPFINYAALWVKQAMIRHIENCSSVIRVPVHARNLLVKYKRMCAQFKRDLGREPTGKEIRGFLGISEETVSLLKKTAGTGNMRSLDDVLPDADGLTLADTIADPRDEYEALLDELENEDLAAVLWPMVDDLPDQQGQIIRFCYADRLTMKQAATAAGVTYENARRQRDKAINTLRKPSRSGKLLPFLSEQAFSLAYHGSAAAFERTWTSSTEKAALYELE